LNLYQFLDKYQLNNGLIKYHILKYKIPINFKFCLHVLKNHRVLIVLANKTFWKMLTGDLLLFKSNNIGAQQWIDKI